ncbi:MAG: hypothetical protein WA177_14845, partial [Xanthobacteraceae bacterium]
PLSETSVARRSGRRDRDTARQAAQELASILLKDLALRLPSSGKSGAFSLPISFPFAATWSDTAE